MKIQSPKDNLSKLTTEELINKKRSTSFAIGLLAGVLIGLFTIIMFQTTNKGATPFLAVPFALLPPLIIIYGQAKSINKELKNRK